ncbi:hypothetical protein GCM10007159_02700 [Modicisalibacter luteus]|nr:hypothetical protein GCM10007159_02700 [Halomonas lutea]
MASRFSEHLTPAYRARWIEDGKVERSLCWATLPDIVYSASLVRDEHVITRFQVFYQLFAVATGPHHHQDPLPMSDG